MYPLQRPARSACNIAAWIFDGGALGQFDEFGVVAGTLIERHLKSCAMFDRACGDLASELRDQFGDGPGVGFVEACQRTLADAVEVGVIPPDQLNEDRLLRIEVVVEAAREDACGVGYLLQRAAQARRGDDRVRGLENLGAPRCVGRGLGGDSREFCGASPRLTGRPAASGGPFRGIGHR